MVGLYNELKCSIYWVTVLAAQSFEATGSLNGLQILEAI